MPLWSPHQHPSTPAAWQALYTLLRWYRLRRCRKPVPCRCLLCTAAQGHAED